MAAKVSTFGSPIASAVERETSEQHSIPKSIALHILPGVFILVIFVLIAPPMMRADIPPTLAILGGATLGFIYQLWHLYSEGRKRNGKWSLEGIVLNRQPLPLWQYFVLPIPFVILAFIISGLAGPIGTALLNLMPWLPEWFEMRDPAMLAQYPRGILMVTFVLYIAINGIAAPIIEELYFRGYLMPRIGRFGRWTPFLEAALFTLYHFWQPYYWVTVFLSMVPVVYAVWWKRNVKLGILIHAMMNILGGLLTFGLVMGQ